MSNNVPILWLTQPPIANRITSDAMAAVDCQGCWVSGSSGSNSQSHKWLVKMSESHTTPWLHRWQCDLIEAYLTWIMWAASCLHCQRQSKGRVSSVCLCRWHWPRGRLLGGRVSLPPLDSLKSSLDMKLQAKVNCITTLVRFGVLKPEGYKLCSLKSKAGTS